MTSCYDKNEPSINQKCCKNGDNLFLLRVFVVCAACYRRQRSTLSNSLSLISDADVLSGLANDKIKTFIYCIYLKNIAYF